MDYTDFGYTDYFTRQEDIEKIPEESLPDITETRIDSILHELSGSKIVGGIIISRDGKLIIDLENGKLTYNNKEKNVIIVTNDYIAIPTDEIIICSNTKGMTVTLPSAIGSGQVYDIKNINEGNVTVSAGGSQTIDNELTQTVTQWDSMNIVDYNSEVWAII